ncbi:MAG TPA: CBS domain-containing protein [Gammaproteobacteria bacterium]|nr:CBS domain-containing protein [Gammaproteobacteria bacterium]
MKEDRSSSNTDRTWLEKISQALTGEPQDREQLVEVLRDSEQRNLLDEDSLAMIEGVMQVSEMHVRDIMVPRSQMKTINRNVPPEEFLPSIVESGHSRFPVIGDSSGEVEGILLAKDMLAYFAQGDGAKFDIRDVMRAPIYIPESKRLNVLLKEFRSNRNHMAIVVDEYGGVAGLVTIEDVLEQIVGEIEDEYDVDEDSYIMKYSNDHFSVKALTPVCEFNEYFNASLDEDEFDTIGGLVLKAFGHLPARGESVVLQDFHFTVLRADNRRIHLLQMTIGENPATSYSQAMTKNSEH